MDTGGICWDSEERRKVPILLDKEVTYKHIEKCLVCRNYFWLFFFLRNIFGYSFSCIIFFLYHWTQRPNQRSSYWNQDIESESLRKKRLCCSKPGCGSRKFYFSTCQGMKWSLSFGRRLTSPGNQMENYYARYFLLEAREQIIMLDIFHRP